MKSVREKTGVNVIERAINPANRDFNIGIDLAIVFFIFFKLLEVFTSVPPDPVSIVHCRHWVVFFDSHPAGH
jgi:hypothetical protein